MINPISYWRDKKENLKYLNKTGKIVSFSRIVNPPQGFGLKPYYVAVLEFNGQKTTGQLVTEAKQPEVGTLVKGILRILNQPDKKGIVNYGVKFKVI
jgi:uncharacterized OB-fold protein